MRQLKAKCVDKPRMRSVIAKSFEKMGIEGKPVGAEKVQEQIAARGVNPEDNAFSRALLRMREE